MADLFETGKSIVPFPRKIFLFTTLKTGYNPMLSLQKKSSGIATLTQRGEKYGEIMETPFLNRERGFSFYW